MVSIALLFCTRSILVQNVLLSGLLLYEVHSWWILSLVLGPLLMEFFVHALLL